MGGETDKKKKKSKSKDPKDAEDPDKKKKKKKSKSEEKDRDSSDKNVKKEKKDKKKKKKEEDSPKPKKKKTAIKIEAFKGPKDIKLELYEADKPSSPSEDATKYGDVTSPALQKKCKKLYKLLNFDPWNNARRYDDDDMIDYVLDNPEPCSIKFEFDGFSGCIYPFSMCFALHASRDTVEAVYDAFPKALKETDWWIGTPYHYAGAYAAPAEIVRFLLLKDPSGVEATNYYGRTALHMGALFKAPIQSMELLCNKFPEACQTQDKDGYIPLHLACENGASAEVVKLLVTTYPASLYAAAQYAMTPLHFAAGHNPSIRVIQVLLDQAAESSLCKATDLLGHTPLHMALMGLAPFEVIEALVSFCPETVWMKTQKGELPLEIAERKRAPAETLKLLEKVMERILLGDSGQ